MSGPSETWLYPLKLMEKVKKEMYLYCALERSKTKCPAAKIDTFTQSSTPASVPSL